VPEGGAPGARAGGRAKNNLAAAPSLPIIESIPDRAIRRPGGADPRALASTSQ